MYTFSNTNALPKFHKLGFEVITLPLNTWNLLHDFYQLLKPHVMPEEDIKTFIHNQQGESASDLMQMNIAPHWVDTISQQLLPLAQQWVGESIELSLVGMYGIRSYSTDAMLKLHTDRIATHHVGGIIVMDYLGENWPLDFQDHDGNWHQIYAEPGQMILYESAVCLHGKQSPFQGEYFRNCYIHWRLKNWNYQEE